MNLNQPSRRPVENQTWGRCPSGMVRGMVHDLRKRRHRRTLLNTLLLALILAGGLFAAGWLRDEFGPAQMKRLGCAEVIQLREAYSGGDLNQTLVRSVSFHLANCRHCRDYYAPEDVRQPAKPPCPFAKVTLRSPSFTMSDGSN